MESRLFRAGMVSILAHVFLATLFVPQIGSIESRPEVLLPATILPSGHGNGRSPPSGGLTAGGEYPRRSILPSNSPPDRGSELAPRKASQKAERATAVEALVQSWDALDRDAAREFRLALARELTPLQPLPATRMGQAQMGELTVRVYFEAGQLRQIELPGFDGDRSAREALLSWLRPAVGKVPVGALAPGRVVIDLMIQLPAG